MRSTYFVSFFRSFVRYPDCLITCVDQQDAGSSKNVAASFFGLDWGIESEGFAFADEDQKTTPYSGVCRFWPQKHKLMLIARLWSKSPMSFPCQTFGRQGQEDIEIPLLFW